VSRGAKGDPLEMIARVVPFESFRAEIEAAVLTPVSEKKSTAGRKPIDGTTEERVSARPTSIPTSGFEGDPFEAVEFRMGRYREIGLHPQLIVGTEPFGLARWRPPLWAGNRWRTLFEVGRCPLAVLHD
jgi:hypothetical protein